MGGFDLQQRASNWINEAIEKSGLSNTKAGLRVGVSEGTMSNWRKGNSFPDIIQAQKFADEFGADLHYLLTGSPALPPPQLSDSTAAVTVIKEDHRDCERRELDLSRKVIKLQGKVIELMEDNSRPKHSSVKSALSRS